MPCTGLQQLGDLLGVVGLPRAGYTPADARRPAGRCTIHQVVDAVLQLLVPAETDTTAHVHWPGVEQASLASLAWGGSSLCHTSSAPGGRAWSPGARVPLLRLPRSD